MYENGYCFTVIYNFFIVGNVTLVYDEIQSYASPQFSPSAPRYAHQHILFLASFLFFFYLFIFHNSLDLSSATNMCKGWGIPWSMGNLPVAILLKNDSPFPSWHKKPLVPDQGVGPEECPTHLCWNLAWLDLVQFLCG